jgi:hypothetical protein
MNAVSSFFSSAANHVPRGTRAPCRADRENAGKNGREIRAFATLHSPQSLQRKLSEFHNIAPPEATQSVSELLPASASPRPWARKLP